MINDFAALFLFRKNFRGELITVFTNIWCAINRAFFLAGEFRYTYHCDKLRFFCLAIYPRRKPDLVVIKSKSEESWFVKIFPQAQVNANDN